MMFNAYHDSQNLFYREPFGAVECGQQITFRLKTCSAVPIDACILRLWDTDQEKTINLSQSSESPQSTVLDSETGTFEDNELFGEYEAPQIPGLVWYYFVIRVGSQTYYYGNNLKKLGGEGAIWDHEPPSFQITVYRPVTVPEWYKRGVMYQIFVDRFFNDQKNEFIIYPRKNALLHAKWSDSPIYIKDKLGRVTDWDFFGGTLQGVTEKIPYFKELGISILYFNPIFDAASNHKYDTADYHRIDPMYGDEKVFKRLIETARQSGISIILDGVFSHTGSDSIYFNKNGNYPVVGAYQSFNSPYYNWYKFKTDHQEYESWWGVDSLPEVNEMDPSYREFIYGAKESVINKWLNMGVAGWRLDVADELPDEFIQGLRQSIKRVSSNAVLIGEVWEDASNKISYDKQRTYFTENELDATMNYPFRATFLSYLLGKCDSGSVHQEMMSLYENYPSENFYACMNLIGSHDTIRILTLLGDAPPQQSLTDTEQRVYRLTPHARHLGVQRLKIFSLIQMTFPGVPCIYYGDEVGVEGYADPYNRGTYPWGQEDNELLDWYRRILRLHAEYEPLKTGDFKSFYFSPDVYGFTRATDEEEIIILINRHSEESKTVNLLEKIQPTLFDLDLIDILNGQTLTPDTLRDLPINALSGRVLLRKKNQPPNLLLKRSCGILLHISSLPSSWDLGDLGKEAYEFVDFLVDSGQSLWQVLPLNPAGVGDCPYQSDSVFAGNPLFISLDHLIQEGLLSLEETCEKFDRIRSLNLRQSLLSLAYKELKHDLLHEAYRLFITHLEFNPNGWSINETSTYLSQENYLKFHTKNKEWLDDYALYRALKTHLGDVPWYDWEPEVAWRETKRLSEYSKLLQEEIRFIQFLQYTFFFEWDKLRIYAKAKGISIIGDLPHFVAADSCDVWVNRSLFILDEQGRPAKTAGVPPDYFSKTGQLWGNPIYDWDAQSVTQYDWWKKRIQLGLELFDYLRLDHFRGFEAYWEVDAGEETAEKGRWIKGPGKRFFESLLKTFGRCPFIVEDLGFLTTEVNVLKRIFALPGIKVLQFTPLQEIIMNSEPNFVYYTGTHDNNTLLGWYEKTHLAEGATPFSGGIEQKTLSRKACRELIEGVYLSQAAWVILPMQDILGLGEEARMNVPGTINGNWQWRMDNNSVPDEIKIWLRTQAKKSNR